MYVWMDACIYVCTYVRMYECMYVCMCVCVHRLLHYGIRGKLFEIIKNRKAIVQSNSRTSFLNIQECLTRLYTKSTFTQCLFK